MLFNECTGHFIVFLETRIIQIIFYIRADGDAGVYWSSVSFDLPQKKDLHKEAFSIVTNLFP